MFWPLFLLFNFLAVFGFICTLFLSFFAFVSVFFMFYVQLLMFSTMFHHLALIFGGLMLPPEGLRTIRECLKVPAFCESVSSDRSELIGTSRGIRKQPASTRETKRLRFYSHFSCSESSTLSWPSGFPRNVELHLASAKWTLFSQKQIESINRKDSLRNIDQFD